MCRTALIAFSLSAPVGGVAAAQEEATLPGGASSLQETYQDWLVVCVQEKGKRCVLLQRTQQNGQQLMAIELAANADGKTATGTLVLPFGLALDAGVALQVDDKPVGKPLRYSTCLAAGCVVPLSVDAPSLVALHAGEVLKATAKAADSGQAIPLSISLKGFSAAFNRVAELTE
ncbi:MAG: invasion associated locus B family protein [Phyllobacterium sp.]